MSHFLLSVHTVEGEAREPMSDEQMQVFMAKVAALEAEMEAAGALVASGRLSGPGAAIVVRAGEGETFTTDGPFAETKEHLGGIYVISCADADAAQSWAAKTSECVGQPIEVRAFMGFRAVSD